MSIATAITNAQNKIAACYTAISGKGGTLPVTQDLANMPTAINSISGGVTVNSLSVTENGTYTAPAGTAYSPVTVNVSGGGGGGGVKKAEIDANGAITFPTTLDVSNIVTVGQSVLRYWQYNNTTLTGSLTFSRLTTIGNTGFAQGFYGCTGLTAVSFPALTTVGYNAIYSIFQSCTGITEIHFKASAQSVITAQSTYNTKFGATNATIYFDL